MFQFDEISGLDIESNSHPDVVADSHSLPIRDGCASSVQVQHVLEHVIDPLRVLSESYRILEGGGILKVATPFMWVEHPHPIDYHRLSASGLDFLLLKLGLKLRFVETEPWTGVFNMAGMTFTMANAKKSRYAPFVNTFTYICALILFRLRSLDRLIECDRIYMQSVAVGIKDSEDIGSKAMATLLFLWARRPDLQRAFTEVSSSDYSNLLKWAVTSGLTIDGAKTMLEPYRSWLLTNPN
jgi:hypothetical protein